MAGPAVCAAAVPVSTKMPAPMMAPMPSIVRLSAPSARLSVTASPSAAASACRCAMLLVDHKPIAGFSRVGRKKTAALARRRSAG